MMNRSLDLNKKNDVEVVDEAPLEEPPPPAQAATAAPAKKKAAAKKNPMHSGHV